MLILSKYKDYYDYLTGIYGVDEKIVLDRREFDTRDFTYNTKAEVFRAYICGMYYSGICDKDGIFYWGEEMRKFEAPKVSKKNRWKYYNQYDEGYNDDRYIAINFSYISKAYIENRSFTRETNFVNIVGLPDKGKNNEKYNCPILLEPTFAKTLKYPPLHEIGFNRMLSPQEIYLMLNEWLAPKDNVEDKQTDKEKIVSKGFDLKTSFRKM